MPGDALRGWGFNLQGEDERAPNEPRETTMIPTVGAGAILGAAAYIAVVAYPLDWSRRDKFVGAFKSWYTKNAIARGYEVGQTNYTALRNRKIESAFNRVWDIIVNQRFPAIDAGFNPLIAAGPMTTDGSLDNAITVLAQRRGKKHVDAKPIFETIEYDKKHFIRDVWSPTKPVLHLTMMLRELTVQADTTKFPPLQTFDIEWCARNADKWLNKAVSGAEQWRLILCAHNIPSFPKLRIHAKDTVKLISE